MNTSTKVENNFSGLIMGCTYTQLFSLQIYKSGLYGARHQWLYWSGRHGLLSQLSPGILGIVWEDDCTPDQIKQALEGTITFDPITIGNTEPFNKIGISGYVSTVLEPSDIPVTGTPSISLISNSINCRWTLYKKPASVLFNWINGEPLIFLITYRWSTCYRYTWRLKDWSNPIVQVVLHTIKCQNNRDNGAIHIIQ